jgi:hypothetical protein
MTEVGIFWGMAYYGVTFLSGLRIVVEASSKEDARARALEKHPTEEVSEVVYLTVLQ